MLGERALLLSCYVFVAFAAVRFGSQLDFLRGLAATVQRRLLVFFLFLVLFGVRLVLGAG